LSIVGDESLESRKIKCDATCDLIMLCKRLKFVQIGAARASATGLAEEESPVSWEEDIMRETALGGKGFLVGAQPTYPWKDWVNHFFVKKFIEKTAGKKGA